METGHATAREAAGIALAAQVRRLVLTHFSARYSRDPSDLEREAKELFPNVTIARDGMEIDVPYDAEDDRVPDAPSGSGAGSRRAGAPPPTR